MGGLTNQWLANVLRRRRRNRRTKITRLTGFPARIRWTESPARRVDRVHRRDAATGQFPTFVLTISRTLRVVLSTSTLAVHHRRVPFRNRPDGSTSGTTYDCWSLISGTGKIFVRTDIICRLGQVERSVRVLRHGRQSYRFRCRSKALSHHSHTLASQFLRLLLFCQELGRRHRVCFL